ncbi:MAG: DUF72 domain-containing protein [Desulfobacca sp.]|nr:DUF72 domain-containing protein [Desulfobacca sp.]
MDELKNFLFRSLHPDIFLGTASDRYAGWLGQIYSKEKYSKQIHRRTKRFKGKTFMEETLPIDSLEDYFEHFSILELDYTFYRPLLDEQGKPSQNFFLLKQYGTYLKEQDFLFLKVPQNITARKIHKGPTFAENETYLNPHIFTEQFYKPALHLLGSKIKGFIFEQEYHRQAERLPESELASSLDHFFKAIPRDDRYHLELRTESYWQVPVFEVLEKYGVGQVLSHWTWLPPLEKQFDRGDRRFFNAGGQALIRLMTPLGMRYEDAYEKAFPFDKLVEGMMQPRMIEETVRLMRLGIEQQVQMNIIINNRSGGSAPLIARQLAEQFLNSKEKN